MTTKHTPGPWEEFKGIVSAENGSVTCIADCRNATNGGNWSGTDYSIRSYRDANARLIATAPELLDALTALCALEADGKHADESAIEVWERARAVRAKATGESHGQ